jgi:ppGpp synthetase/RelA/SpoT-type nucleotidyltranferase
MNFPKKYNASKYVEWHHLREPNDLDLPHKLDQLIQELKKKSIDDVKLLTELFQYFRKYSKKEYNKLFNKKTEFELSEINYKKPTRIINKLWRKYNNNKKFVSLKRLENEITDLIRTEIIGDTLTSCKFFVERFKKENIHDKLLKTKCDKKIMKISHEPEMKMESGYFAYHILIYFNDNIKIEIQIYSAIIKEWRDLSHLLYEIVRDSPIDHEFGSKESRLISLGHLFHLAECEIERLQDEFDQIAPPKS